MTEADDREPLDLAAEEFLARWRRGERPHVTEFIARLPERGDEVREFLSALVMVEQLKPDPDETAASTSPPAEEPPVGRLGEYRILREIGRGGMGVVYEAEQESLGRRVALKVLTRRSVDTDDRVRRFLREARAAAQLHHTNIVPVFAVGEQDGLHYYAMQFIRGLGLDAVLGEVRNLEPAGPSAAAIEDAPTRESPFDATTREMPEPGPADADAASAAERERRGHGAAASNWSDGPTAGPARGYPKTVADVGRQVADALEYAHQQGVIHRDIKPSNLLLDAHGTVWVTDFGLAKSTEDIDDLTRTGDLVGTVRYMAPERFRGRCDARSDIYALGLTLYELLARRPAFDATDREDLLYRVTQTDPPRLRTIDGRIPRDLETIIHKAIDRDPACRYATSGALARDLTRFLEGRPIEARRSSVSDRLLRWARRNPAPAALGSAVVLLLLAIAIGSTAAAVRLRREHAEAVAAGRDARERLWESYLAQARARRRGGEAGRRFAALEHVDAAARLGVHPDRRWELRDEAIACFALTDLRVTVPRADSESTHGDDFAFDADFSRYVRRESDGRVIVRRASDDRELLELPAPPSPAVGFRFSRDGRRLAAKCDDGRRIGLAMWDLDERKTLLGAPEGVFGDAFDFSHDGRWFAAGRRDGTVNLHHAEDGRLARRLSTLPEPKQLAFDPANRRLAVSSLEADTSLAVYDLQDGSVVASFSLTAAARGIAWHPDGRRIAAGSDDGTVFLVDVENPGGRPELLEGHQGAVVSAAFHPGGDLLATASRDGTLRLWDVDAAKSVVSAPLPEATAVRFSRDGRLLGPGRDGSSNWHWEVAYGRACRDRTDWSGPIEGTTEIQIAPGRSLLIATGAGGVRIDSLARGGTIGSIPLPGTSSSVFLPDASSLITAGEAGLLSWPVKLGSDETMAIGPPRPFALTAGLPTGRVRLAPDGRTMAVVLDSERGHGVLFDVGRPEAKVPFAGHPGLERLAFSVDSRWLATGTRGGTGVHVYDVRTGRTEAELAVEGSADVLFTPDGRSLVTGSGAEYRSWETGTWRPGPGIERVNTGGEPGKMAVSPDGTLLAPVRSRSVVQLVNPESFEVLTTLVPPKLRNVASLTFSPGGGRFVVAHNTRVLTLWDLRTARTELAAIGLDLPTPPLPSSPPDGTAPTLLRVDLPAWSESVRLAESHAAAERWEEATSAYEAAFAAGNRNPRDWSRQALLALAAGDLDRYRTACREATVHFDGSLPSSVAHTLARACTLGPDCGVDAERIVRLAESGVGGRDDRTGPMTLGAALFRARRFDDARQALERSVAAQASGGTPFEWAFLAMTLHHLDRPAEAREWLGRLESDDGKLHPNVAYWADRLELRLLREEARILVTDGK